MQRYLPLIALVVLVAAAVTISRVAPRTPSTDDSNLAAAKAHLANLVVAPGIQHGNLTIWPVLSRTSRLEDQYITLDEGLAAGKVEIYEVGGDGNRISQRTVPNLPVQTQATGNELQFAANSGPANEVNRLMLVNRSGKPLYLMSGEVIVGGSQDRSIAQERVIASSDEPVSLDVFCVEHGRWGGRGGEGGSNVMAALTTAHQVNFAADPAVTMPLPPGTVNVQELAGKADSGRFVLSAGNLNKAGRLAVLDSKDQGAVWKEVEVSVQKSQSFATLMGETAQTGSFTGNYASADVVKRLEPYLTELHAPVDQKQNVVGAIVAINGNIETFDVFESTPLFRKLWPKLLKSYALDAAAAADQKASRSTPAVAIADASRFLRKGMLANVSHSEITADGLEVYRCPTNGFIGFSARRPDAIGGEGGATINGVSAAPLHACGFSSR